MSSSQQQQFDNSGGNKRRKRRRRKKALKKLDDDNDELPEFDLPEFDNNKDDENKANDMMTMQQKKDTKPIIPSKDGGILELSLSDDISTSSMSSSPISSTSVKSLLRTRDKSMEDAFEFDNVVDNPLPRYGSSSSSTTSDVDTSLPRIGKKRAKAEARRAAAIEAERLKQEEENEFDLISFLPFYNKIDDQSPVKILEYFAWVGIFLLVLWEAYINSPFFERAAPMAPVVYQIYL